MKTIRDYINLIIESEQTGKWRYKGESSDPSEVPGTEYFVFPKLYRWEEAPNTDGRTRINLTDSRKIHYLFVIDILDQEHNIVENMELDHASKMIRSVYNNLCKEFDIVSSYDITYPRIDKIVAGTDVGEFNVLITRFIDQS
jgi:hypothetical protein